MANFPGCNCPITKTVTVTFTGSTPAPSNGYLVRWHTATGSDNYVTPNPTSSPFTIPNVPVCEDVTVIMQSQCNNSQLSSEVTYTIPKQTLYACGDTLNVSHTHNGYYLYPEYLIDVRTASGAVDLLWDVTTKPNKFSVYDYAGNLVATTGWKGTATYAGPWGATLSTLSTGTLSFTPTSGACYYKLVVESVTDVSTQDAFTVNVTCPSSGAAVTPTITYLSCSSGYGSYRIDAPSGTTMKVKLTATGSLTNNSVNGNCARLEGTLSSSTGPGDSEQSNTVNTTGGATIGSNNSLFVNVTVPGAGYVVINTSVFTINSSSSATTATLTIFEVNGSATTITQAVCAQNSTGTVSCGSATYNNYYAVAYYCSTGQPVTTVNDYTLVALPVATTVVYNDYYVPSSDPTLINGIVYKVISASSSGPGLILSTTHNSLLSSLCNIT